jgi:hypothetical protein
MKDYEQILKELYNEMVYCHTRGIIDYILGKRESMLDLTFYYGQGSDDIDRLRKELRELREVVDGSREKKT